MNTPNPPRPFLVTAVLPEDAAIASQLLRLCGLQAWSVFDAQPPDDSATSSLEQITRAGGAVAAVRGPELPAAVIYELGVARGLGLPTMVLFLIGVDDELPLLPGDLRGLQQVRWDPGTSPDAALLDRVRGLLTSSISQFAGLPTGRRRHSMLERTFADEVERRAAEVLTLVGAEVVAEGPGNRPGYPDLSARFSDLPNWANPVLIEVKAHDPSGLSHEAAIQQLRTYLHTLQLPIGMVLVPGEHQPAWTSGDGTAIVTVGVETLASLGAPGTRSHLIRGRSLAAHSA